MLKELLERGPGDWRPIEFLGTPVPVAATELRVSGYLVHCRVRKLGLGRASSPADWQCSSSRCPVRQSPAGAVRALPSSWSVLPPTDVRLLAEHHADLIITDSEHDFKFQLEDKYVALHGTTPVFHPNVGYPDSDYCLGKPSSSPEPRRQPVNLGWYLDQFLAIIGWHAANETHQRDKLALSYWRARQQARLSSLEPSASRPDYYQHGYWKR